MSQWLKPPIKSEKEKLGKERLLNGREKILSFFLFLETSIESELLSGNDLSESIEITLVRNVLIFN